METAYSGLKDMCINTNSRICSTHSFVDTQDAGSTEEEEQMSNNAQERSNARILEYVHAEKAPCKLKHQFHRRCSVSILRAHDMVISLV